MTIANDIIGLALRTAGVVGVGQTPLPQDIADSLTVLNNMILNWNNERSLIVYPQALPQFADLVTDVPFWTSRESALRWGLSVRLRPLYGLPEDKQQTELATNAVTILQATNRQQMAAQVAAQTDTTGNGLILLALRAAGRITDVQDVALGSQDMTDGLLFLQEMIGEWQLERTVTVTPGVLPIITDPTAAVALPAGYASAIVLNLAVRVRDAFGLEENKGQTEAAGRALARLQANNKQFQPSPTPGATGTVLQLIYRALRVAGRINDGQSVAPGSQDVTDAFAALVEMLGQWQRKRWLIPSLAELVTVSTGNAAYTIGMTAAGQLGFTDDFTDGFVKNPAIGIVAPRPDRIETAFARLIAGGLEVDYPLTLLDSREDYAGISVKGLVSFPSTVFYDPTYPYGTLYFWPAPPMGQYELHVFVKAQLQQFAAVTDALMAPPEYVEAMVYNLAARVCMFSGVPVRPDIANVARASLETIRNANIAVPNASMPPALGGPGYGGSWLGGFIFPAGAHV